MHSPRRDAKIAVKNQTETGLIPMITYHDLRQNEDLKTYIRHADASLAAQGFTEHSFAHVGHVADTAASILRALHYPDRTVELAQIAAYLHDIGNLINRVDHSQSGAIMAFRLLDKLGMPPEELAVVVTAIGNHDEGTGVPVDPVAAALILADKSDVRRSRVRNQDPATFDIHDRVNYSVENTAMSIDTEQKTITLRMTINQEYSTIMDYFEIFLNRMILCRKAADRLGLRFQLRINNQSLL